MRKFFKYLTYTLVFMVMSIVSAYGAITISMNNASIMQNSLTNPKPEPLPEQLTSIYENITNSDAMQVNLSASVASSTENYIIDIALDMDTSKGFDNLELDGALKIAGSSQEIYDIAFSYQDGIAYFDMFNGRIAVDTTTVLDPIMSILKILNVEVPSLGIDLSQISPEMILGMLTNFTENKNENDTITLAIDVPVVGKLNLVCDLDYNVQEFSLPTISFNEDTSLTLSSNIKYPESIEITEKVESDYVKLGNLLNVAETVLATLSQDNIGFEFSLDIEETELEGRLFADLQELSAMACLDLFGKELRLIAVDNVIYIEYANIFASFALDDFEKINQILNSQFGIDLPLDTITNLLSALKDGDFSKLMDEFNVDVNPASLDLSILESVIVKNNLTSVKIRDVGDFGVIVDDNGNLKRMAYSGNDISAVLKTTAFKEFELASGAETYIDLAKLLPTAENAISILKCETLSGNIDLSLFGTNIPFVYEISKKAGNEVYANIEGDFFGAKLNINYLENKIFVSLAQNPLIVIDTTTLKSDINDFLAELKIDLQLDTLIQLGGIFGSLIDFEKPLFTALEETQNGFILSTDGGLDIVVANNTNEIKLSSSNFITANIVGGDGEVVKATVNENDFAPFENILALGKAFVEAGLLNTTEGVINYFKNGNLALNFNVDYQGTKLSGNLNFNVENKSIKVSLDIEGKPLNLLLINGNVYLEHGNIFAKFAINDLSAIENLCSEYFGIELPLGMVVEIFETLNGNTPLSILASLGLSLDLSSIDLAFFDSIVVDGNTTTIPVESVGDIKVTLDNKVLSNVQFVSSEISANVEFVEFKEFSLATGEANYVELINLLPTIENAIDIVRSETISGVIEVTIDDTTLPITYIVDKKDTNDIYASFKTNVLGADIELIYTNGKVYLNTADAFKLAVNVNSLPDDILEFLTAIGVELNTDDTLYNILGLIISGIYNEESPLLVTEFTETENGLIIEILNSLTLTIENGSNELTLNGTFNNVNVKATLLGASLEVERTIIDETEYNQFGNILDLAEKVINSGLVEVAEGAFNYFNTTNFGLNFSVNDEVSGSINVDLEDMSMKLTLNYSDFSANILLVNNVIYLELGNVYAKFAIEDLTEVERFVNDYFAVNLPITETIEFFNELQTSDSPLAILAGLGLSLDLSSIDLALFDSIVVDGNTTTIPVENVGDIKVILDDKVLSNIEFNSNDLSANVDFVEFKEFTLATGEANYVELINLLPTIENAINIVRSETISGVIEINVDDTTLPITYVVDKKDTNDIYASFKTNVLGADIELIYTNGKVYLNTADAFKLAVNVNSLPEDILEFLTAINAETDSEETTNDIVDTINSVLYNEAPLLITSLIETENGIEIEVYNGLKLSLVNGSIALTINGTYNNVNVKATLLGGSVEVEREVIDETEYNQFETVLDLAERFINTGLIDIAEGVYNYFKNGITLGLNFTATYKETALTGSLHLNLEAKEIKVSVIYDGVAINVIVLDKVAYLEIGNIYAKFAVSDLDKIEALIRDYFGLDIPLSQVIDFFEDTTQSDKPLESLSEIGNIDLSGIDLAFFDNIVAEGNTTTIPVENVGDIKVTLDDKVLSNISFIGSDINASANFVDFEGIKLSVNQDSYIDLVKLLPTIENAITIVQSNVISGTINVDTDALGETLNIDFLVNKKDTSNVYAEFSTAIQGANIKVMYLDGKVYIEFAQSIKLVADFDTLPETINSLLEKADVAFEIDETAFNSNSILSTIFGVIDPANTPILITGLAEGADNSLTITLHDQTSIILSNLSREIDFSSAIDGTGLSGFIIGDDTEMAIPTIDESLYIPIDDILDLVEAFLNMAKLDDFHISGTFDIVGTLAGIDITWNVPFDIRIKNVDGNFEMQMVMGEIPVVVGLNNDVPFVTGDSNGGKNRYLTIYVKDGDIYIYRSEDVNVLFGWDTRRYEKCTKITAETFFADPMRYVQYAIGFSDTIMDAIAESVAKASNREAPINLNNVINSLTVVDGSHFEIVLNAAELANNTDLDTLTLNIGLGYDENGESYLATLGLNVFMPLADIFELTLSTSDTKIVNYGSTVDLSALYNYVNNYTYNYDAEWEASNGAWTKASETIYHLYFEENGGEAVTDIAKAYGLEITLPTLAPIETDDGTARTVKTFAGWYTTSTFDEGSEFTSSTMPKGDKTLYANWNVEVTYYRTISFVTNSDETLTSIKALEGSEIILPSLSLKEIVSETSITVYSFEGWFIDEGLTQGFTGYIMPSEDITLYAKWEVANIEEAKLLQIYDNGSVIYSRYILAGREINLSSVGKINDTTKFYLASNYTTLYEGEFIMPDYDLSLHIRNQYTLKVVSEYGTATNSEVVYWQGASISIPAQATYVDDDYTTRQITYTFNGYKVNGTISTAPTVMPNTNTTVEASWTVTTKKYYTVSFVTTWVKPDEWMDNENKWTGNIDCKTPAGTISPVKVLEGTTFDPSSYTTTAKYSYQAMLITANYDFKILAWNTTGVVNISNGATNGSYDTLAPFEITENVTLYPTWGVY